MSHLPYPYPTYAAPLNHDAEAAAELDLYLLDLYNVHDRDDEDLTSDYCTCTSADLEYEGGCRCGA